MPFVVFAAPFSSPEFVSASPLTITSLLSIVSSLSSPAMHLGIPQDMESDPDDEVKQILHHHMELLLLCRPFCWLYCRCCSVANIWSLYSTLVWKMLLTARFFYTATSLLK